MHDSAICGRHMGECADGEDEVNKYVVQLSCCLDASEKKKKNST